MRGLLLVFVIWGLWSAVSAHTHDRVVERPVPSCWKADGSLNWTDCGAPGVHPDR